MEQKKKGINSNQLKCMAITSMTVDHLVSVIYPGYPKEWWILLLHLFGRLAAPTMWFMIAEGYYHTRNVKRYAGRLFLFAVISHFAYNFAFGIPFIPFQTSVFNQTSVIWPLAWGVVALYITDERHFQWKNWQQVLMVLGICALTFPSDWSCIAVLSIIAIGTNRGDLKAQTKSMMLYVSWYAIVYFLCIDKVYGLLQLGVIICVPFVKMYNGERGNWKGMKWFFYLYYPLHLILCGIIRIILHGDMGVIIGG